MSTVANGAHQRGYLDFWVARVVALVIAAAMFALIFITFGEAIGGAVGLDRSAERGSNFAAEGNPALERCLEQRFGDIERDRAAGVLSERQHASFRGRAEQLCRGQYGG